jgi:hypothetical protein
MPTKNVYTNKQLIQAGREFAARHGGHLRQVDWTSEETIASRSTICLRFGSWKEFCDLCQVDEPGPSADDLVKAGIELANANHGQLRVNAWDKARPLGVGRSYVIARFGSWGAFRDACGISDGTVTDEQLVEWGAQISLALGRQITIADINGDVNRLCTSQTIFNRFGSFSAFADRVKLAAARMRRSEAARKAAATRKSRSAA